MPWSAARAPGETPPQIVYAEVGDFKTANMLGNTLARGAEDPELFRRIDQLALATLIN